MRAHEGAARWSAKEEGALRLGLRGGRGGGALGFYGVAELGLGVPGGRGGCLEAGNFQAEEDRAFGGEGVGEVAGFGTGDGGFGEAIAIGGG